MNISIRNGDVLAELKKLHDNSVDCIITSPPYLGLRDYSVIKTIYGDTEEEADKKSKEFLTEYRKGLDEYSKSVLYSTKPVYLRQRNKWACYIQYDVTSIWDGEDGCEHEWASHSDSLVCTRCGAWKGQLGQEPDFRMYLGHLLIITKELKRILKPTGTMFWNMSDTYNGSTSGKHDVKTTEGLNNTQDNMTKVMQRDIPLKSQLMIPERFAMRMIDEQGWTKRNSLIWYKRSAMPTSSQDRFANKYEFVFFFTRSKRYWSDLDSVRKKLSQATIDRISQNVENQFQSGKVDEFSDKTGIGNMKKTLMNMKIRNQMKDATGIMRNPMAKHSGYFKSDSSPLFNTNGANPGDVLYDSKYTKDMETQTGSPAGRIMRNLTDGKTYTTVKKDINNVNLYLKEKLKESGLTIAAITEISKMPETKISHYFRTDENGSAIPDIFFWDSIKERLSLGDYEDFVSVEIREISMNIGSENGSNPGDTFIDDINRMDRNIMEKFYEFLEREYPELVFPSVLDIPPRGHDFHHFAVFPTTLVEPLLKFGCAKEVCSKCGKPKMPHYKYTGRTYDHGNGEFKNPNNPIKERKIMEAQGASESSTFKTDVIKEKIVEWIPSCNCNAEFIPGTVLDPFGGSGTVGVVAKNNGRNAILLEINPEYVEIMKKRLDVESNDKNMDAKFTDVATTSDLEEYE